MTQLDLFGQVLADETQRYVNALTCLRDAVPNALEVVAQLQYEQPDDSRSPHANGDWAYCVCRAGVRFERVDDWWSGARARGETWGWNRTPAHLVTWEELATLIGQDRRRDDVIAWVGSLPEPQWGQWRLLTRPHELGPDPDTWHPSYKDHDHADPQWPGRWRAWQLVLDLLGDAIRAVMPHPDGEPSHDGEFVPLPTTTNAKEISRG
jgi:hypothetical protein